MRMLTSSLIWTQEARASSGFFHSLSILPPESSGTAAEDVILLLDEPGLHLHGTAQEALLSFFRESVNKQIVFTTHSPFMVPIENIGRLEP